MHFAFTEQQLEFRDAVRQVLAKECGPADVRAAYEAPSARSRRWSTLAELGVVGLTVPEAEGGLGLGLVDLVPLLEEAGRVALPEPLVETTALAIPLLAELGTGDEPGRARRRWLGAISRGEVAAAVGIEGPDVPLAGAEGADLYLLTAPGDGSPEIHLLEPAEVTVTPLGSLDPTRRLGTVRWEPTTRTRLATGPAAVDAVRRTAERAAVAVGSELIGLAEQMISRAAAYAQERHQFGRPIGSFQAVKHLLAGAQVKLEFARPVVYGAAWAVDEGEPHASVAASTAKACAADAADEAARVSLQVHGAIGYTWECDLHLFLKRTWALSEAWGSAAEHRARVLDALVSPS
ncbi:MAG: acyl-CoA dehydrogenase family protein [Acidimicrobiales bacterium]